MKIKCVTKFNHGRDIFEKDDERTVSDELGGYFIAQGWATIVGQEGVAGAAANEEVSLDIQNATIGTGVIHG